MKDKELLYEKYFKFVSDNKYTNRLKFEQIINIDLNSKEFTDSDLLLSLGQLKSNLISLYVTGNTINSFDLSGLYYVTDGENEENISFTGNVTIARDGLVLVLNITRHNSKNDREELSEFFKYDLNNGNIIRYSSYQSGYSEIEVINKLNIDKCSEFKKEFTKALK